MRLIKRKQKTCRCSVYPFPHRKHGGKCQSCNHDKDWRGLSSWTEDKEEGDWCQICADNERYLR